MMDLVVELLYLYFVRKRTGLYLRMLFAQIRRIENDCRRS